MACGKSSVGVRLAELLHFDFVDLDKEIEYRVGKSVAAIFAQGGESAFRELEFTCLASLIEEYKESNLVIALGGGAITNNSSRELILNQTTCIYIKVSLDTIRQRLGKSCASRPLYADAEKLYPQREPIYSQAHICVDADAYSSTDLALLLSRAVSEGIGKNIPI